MALPPHSIPPTTLITERSQLLPATSYDFAETANTANSAVYATQAANSDFATTATHANTADSANTANTANTATFANVANTANTAVSANTANTANTADSANTANTATNATNALQANNADNATNANNSTYFGTHPITDFLFANASVILFANVVVTDSQLKTLNSSPIILVANAGVGKIIQPYHLVARIVQLGTYSALPGNTLRYQGGSNNLNWNAIWASNIVQDKLNFTGDNGLLFSNTAECLNKSLIWRADADVTGGNAGNYVSIVLAYAIITI